MKPPIQLPPPILSFFRWLAASITNVVHFGHGAKVVGDTPLPSEVAASLEAAPAQSWGELARLASNAATNGMVQVGESILAHPFVTIAVLWWAYESFIQLKTLLKWLRKQDDDDPDEPER